MALSIDSSKVEWAIATVATCGWLRGLVNQTFSVETWRLYNL